MRCDLRAYFSYLVYKLIYIFPPAGQMAVFSCYRNVTLRTISLAVALLIDTVSCSLV